MKLICGVAFLDGRPVPHGMVDAMCAALQAKTRTARVTRCVRTSAQMAVLEFDPASPDDGVVERGDGCIAGDVHLDEPDELRGRWGLSEARETEIAAEGLRRGSPEALAELYGDFALAAWDEGERSLTLVRDALGVRPLVYHHEAGRWVIFASFERALLATGLVAKRLREETLLLSAVMQYTLGETMLEGVQAVKPGAALTFTASGVRETVYWRPAPVRRTHASFEAAAAELRDLMQRAVTSSLRGLGPAAAHLSGGLDSSALTLLAARTLKQQGRMLHTYSYLAESWPGRETADESPFVQAVLQQEPRIAWTPITHVMSPTWLRDPYHLEVPLSASDAMPVNEPYLLASRAGAQVLLSGWGGDEGISFNGRGALAWAFRAMRWRYLAREMLALRRRRGFRLRHTFLGDVVLPLLPPRLAERWHARRGKGAMPGFGRKAFEHEERRLPPDPVGTQVVLLRSAHLSARTAADAVLAAQYGMAVRYPLLNRRVVEFALSLPRQWHLRNGAKRSVYRAAMSGVLPDAIRDRDTKLVPMPRAFYEFSLQREAIADRIAEMRSHAPLGELFDLQRMEATARSLPPPETAQVRDMVEVPALMTALEHALYVSENF